jgi:hypothetical protein
MVSYERLKVQGFSLSQLQNNPAPHQYTAVAQSSNEKLSMKRLYSAPPAEKKIQVVSLVMVEQDLTAPLDRLS